MMVPPKWLRKVARHKILTYKVKNKLESMFSSTHLTMAKAHFIQELLDKHRNLPKRLEK